MKEKDSSADVVMRTLEKSMACNPHVGLFLSLPNVFEEVVDATTLLQNINSHHHLYNPDSSSGSGSGSGSSSSSSSSSDSSDSSSSSSDSSSSSSDSSGSRSSGSRSSSTEKTVVTTEVSAALAYAIDQFGCWRDAGNDEGDDIRNFVYENVIHEHYEPVENIKSHDLVSPVRLVRATYGEFVLRLNASRSNDVADDFRSSVMIVVEIWMNLKLFLNS